MTDLAYERALLRKHTINQQMDALGAELRRLEEWLSLRDELLSSPSHPLKETQPEPPAMDADIKQRRTIAEAAHEILHMLDGPIPTQQMLSFLESQGVTVGGKDRITNLSSTLSRDSRFRNIKGQGWVLASNAMFPPAPSTDKGAPEKETAATQMEAAV